jgi:polar amino acid transport system substrate-binding protein
LKIGILCTLSLTAFAETTLERIKQRGVIEVGVANERPYGYITAEGKLTGEGPEIARKILAKIDPDIKMVGEMTIFEALIVDLNANRSDMIASGIFITPERCKRVAFSNPTYMAGQAFAVKAGNPKDLTDFKAVAKNPDAKLGVMAGAIEHEYARKAGIGDDQIELFNNPEAGLVLLKQGVVDAVALTSPSIQSLVNRANDPSIEAAPQFFPSVNGEPLKGYGAFAFRKEDQALVDAFNEHLATFIGSEEHWETVREFGFTPEMMPDKTAEELCKG